MLSGLSPFIMPNNSDVYGFCCGRTFRSLLFTVK